VPLTEPMSATTELLTLSLTVLTTMWTPVSLAKAALAALRIEVAVGFLVAAWATRAGVTTMAPHRVATERASEEYREKDITRA
jgi:hypothetical protein